MTSFPAVELLATDHPARALVAGDPRLADLLAHAPGDERDLLAAAKAAAARDIDRGALAAALEARLVELDAPDAAHRALARLRGPGVTVVVTGQQPGLLGGPWMVIVKALAAAALARRVEALGVPCIPLYWHASEDHDLAEADHVTWPTAGGPERLRAPFEVGPRMLSHAALPTALPAIVERVLSELEPAAHGAELASVLVPRSGETFGGWTARVLARLLGAQGIVLVEPASLRRAAFAVAEHELTRPGALHATLAAAEETLRDAGLASPLALRRPELVFLADPETGVRCRVRHDGSGGFDVEGGKRIATPALLEQIRRHPDRISWNVAGRVLAQDVALPVAAQICGPAELAYAALLREAHASLGVPQPALWLRPGVTLVQPRVRRACEALGVAAVDVVLRGASTLPPAGAQVSGLDALRAAVEALPRGRSPAAGRRRREVLRNACLLEEALRREAAERDEVGRRRAATIMGGLRPSGRLAERIVSFLPHYAGSGDAGMARLLAALGNAQPHHHVLSAEDL